MERPSVETLKRERRALLSARRDELAPCERETKSSLLCDTVAREALVPLERGASGPLVVCVYGAFRSEADPAGLAEWCRRRGHLVIAPRVLGTGERAAIPSDQAIQNGGGRATIPFVQDSSNDGEHATIPSGQDSSNDGERTTIPSAQDSSNDGERTTIPSAQDSSNNGERAIIPPDQETMNNRGHAVIPSSQVSLNGRDNGTTFADTGTLSSRDNGTFFLDQHLSLNQGDNGTASADSSTLSRGDNGTQASKREPLSEGDRGISLSGGDIGMELRKIDSPADWTPGKWGVPEPNPAATEPYPISGEIDVVIVPGLAFDRKGGRLGYGGGYYDRLYAARRASAPERSRRTLWIGFAYARQVAEEEELPREPHDLPLNGLATEEGIIWFDGREANGDGEERAGSSDAF